MQAIRVLVRADGSLIGAVEIEVVESTADGPGTPRPEGMRLYDVAGEEFGRPRVEVWMEA